MGREVGRTRGVEEVESEAVWTVDVDVVRRRALIEEIDAGVDGSCKGGVGGCEMTFGGTGAAARLPGMARGLGDGPGLGATSGVKDLLAGKDGACEPVG